jgi:predicted DNA-binding transcriptional regulator AlpA
MSRLPLPPSGRSPNNGTPSPGCGVPTRDLLDRKEVCRMIDFSESTLRRWVDLGLFPAPLKVRGYVRWRLEEIIEWRRNPPPADAR